MAADESLHRTGDFIAMSEMRDADIVAQGMQPHIDAMVADLAILAHEVTDLQGTSLDQLQTVQQKLDDLTWTAPGERNAKRRHILFQLAINVGSLARVEERDDHRREHDEQELLVAVADLFIFSLQLANLSETSLLDLYKQRALERLPEPPES